jgi:hypothetical protein
MDAYGVPAAELSDEELERQRVETHATREWALRRGTDEEFHRHTARLLELEQESLRRHLRRQTLEWRTVVEEATRLGNALRGLIVDMEARLNERPVRAAPGVPAPPVAAIEPPPAASATAAIIANRSWALTRDRRRAGDALSGGGQPLQPSRPPDRSSTGWRSERGSLGQ